jgi:hypothetical protein
VQSAYISGVVHLDESILIVLDFKKILSIDEKQALDGVIPADTRGTGSVAALAGESELTGR